MSPAMILSLYLLSHHGQGNGTKPQPGTFPQKVSASDIQPERFSQRVRIIHESWPHQDYTTCWQPT